MKFTTIFVVVSLLASPAFGHHSDAALRMDSVVTLEGIVTEYSLRNPHAYFTVEVNGEVAGEGGAAVEWTVQMPSSITMVRLGWDRDTLAIGDQVTVGINPARDGRNYGLIYSIGKADGPIDKADGSPLLARPEQAPQIRSEARTTTIEGRWFLDRSRLPDGYPDETDELMGRYLELTDKGEAAAAVYNQASEENPELSCISKPTPALILYTDLFPMEIVINEGNEGEETITLRSQYFDSVRTIYMDGREHPPASEQFFEGHSVGRWEDDVLVIDTTNFAYHRSPYQTGVPSGSQKHVVEWYRLLGNGRHMNVKFLLEDPEYIDGSMSHNRDLIYSPERDMSSFDCDLESTRRFLPD
ncbi:MAG: hypothetical protein HOM55_03160 [Proteobacteria bacterium]|jgi:hypothetical protein|nr:hypothetical protein [Pseudomonadota bacterium]